MTSSRTTFGATGPTVTATGTTGAPHPGRFVGVTTTGAPTTGTYRIGDYIVTQNGQMFVCVAAGTPGTWVTPSDTRNLLAVGEETVSRHWARDTTVLTGTGAFRVTFFTARKSETTTQIRVHSGGTAAAATPTLVRLGLYLVDAAGNGTLVAATANDTTLFAAANTAYTKTWSTPYAKTAGQRYAFGSLVVTSATAPTLVGGVIGSASEAATAPRLAAQITGQTDLPASFTDAALATTGNWQYAAILP